MPDSIADEKALKRSAEKNMELVQAAEKKINNCAKAENRCTMCYRCINICPKQAITLLGKRVIEQGTIEKYQKQPVKMHCR